MVKPSLLVVDDEIAIRTALRRWFSLRGFAVDTAADGVEAVSRCRERHYDIVTIDLDMPQMGGIEAIPILREFHPDMPIIVLTGYARDVDIAIQKGAYKVCVKPLRLSELENEIKSALFETHSVNASSELDI